MDALELQQIARLCGGRVVGDGSVKCAGVATDSRAAVAGNLFIALSGVNFDGHDYVSEAMRKGAVAAMVAANEADRWPIANLVIVEDTLAGLQQFAAGYRAGLPLRVVGVTGSNGKTSTKQMCLAVLQVGFQAAATSGNLNNHIGVPLTLLSFSPELDYGIVEMGMNHPGEIAPLAAMAAPEVGIITNIGRAHIEFFDDRAGIAREKGALLRQLDSDGLAIIPAACDYRDELLNEVAAPSLTVGFDSGDIQASEVTASDDGMLFRVMVDGQSARCRLPLPGEHMVANAMLAIAAGWRAGISLADCCEALQQMEPVAGRLSRRTIAGISVFDDSYNANPDSILAALQVLKSARGNRKWVVLGAMAEQGKHTEASYAEVGMACGHANISGLITIGAETSTMLEAAVKAGTGKTALADEPVQAAEILDSWVAEGDTVLVKGSRSAALEKVIDEFTRLQQQVQGGVT